MSSALAARSSENVRARGSSATRGGGSGTFATVRRSSPLAEAFRIRTTTKRVQEVGRMSHFLVRGMVESLKPPTSDPIVPIGRGKHKRGVHFGWRGVGHDVRAEDIVLNDPSARSVPGFWSLPRRGGH